MTSSLVACSTADILRRVTHLPRIAGGPSNHWWVLLALSFLACSRENAAPTSSTPSTAPSSTDSAAPASSSPPLASSTTATPPLLEPRPKTIGQVKMQDDKTIVLDLYEPAHLQTTYPPSHPEYKKVLDHVGGLVPGETKLVPPWPDDIDDAKVEAAVTAYVKDKKAWAVGSFQAEIMGTSQDGSITVSVSRQDPNNPQEPNALSLVLDPKTYEVKSETVLR